MPRTRRGLGDGGAASALFASLEWDGAFIALRLLGFCFLATHQLPEWSLARTSSLQSHLTPPEPSLKRGIWGRPCPISQLRLALSSVWKLSVKTSFLEPESFLGQMVSCPFIWEREDPSTKLDLKLSEDDFCHESASG